MNKDSIWLKPSCQFFSKLQTHNKPELNKPPSINSRSHPGHFNQWQLQRNGETNKHAEHGVNCWRCIRARVS